jgi:hypothetical protein
VFSGAQFGLQVNGAGTFHTTLVPLLLPPLSASMNDVPAGIGRFTATVVGAGAVVPAGHSLVVVPCGAEQARPKFGPPLQMPVGFDRQKLWFGCADPFGFVWQTSGSGWVVPHGVPLFAESAQKKPLDESPMHWGVEGTAWPQYAFSFCARLHANVRPGHWVVSEPLAAEQARPTFVPPLQTLLMHTAGKVAHSAGGLKQVGTAGAGGVRSWSVTR